MFVPWEVHNFRKLIGLYDISFVPEVFEKKLTQICDFHAILCFVVDHLITILSKDVVKNADSLGCGAIAQISSLWP
jgi:hypothetical protein